VSEEHVARRFLLAAVAIFEAALLVSGCSAGSSGATNYTRLVIPTPDIKTLIPLPDGVDKFASPSSAGQVATVGDILLCTVGKSGTVKITKIAPQGADHLLPVVAFATRPNPYADHPPGAPLGFNFGTLTSNGFPSAGSEVTPCPSGYQHMLPTHNDATMELGISVERVGSTAGEDKSFVLTYKGPTGAAHTLTVPLVVVLCPPTMSNCAY
jgi:hypothetical protein